MAYISVYCLLACVLVGTVSACPDFWTPYEESCYAFIQDLSTWAGAAEKCREMHSELVEVDSIEENEFLKDLVKKTNAATDIIIWLGGNDLLNEANWVWENGEPITYKDWNHGQPDNAFHKENCLSLRPNYAYHWNDAPCSLQYFFICERVDDTNPVIG